MNKMKAIALTRYLPVEDPEAFHDMELEKPVPAGHDILVSVRAIAVNPVDNKVRKGRGNEGKVEDPPRVLRRVRPRLPHRLPRPAAQVVAGARVQVPVVRLVLVVRHHLRQAVDARLLNVRPVRQAYARPPSNCMRARLP